MTRRSVVSRQVMPIFTHPNPAPYRRRVTASAVSPARVRRRGTADRPRRTVDAVREPPGYGVPSFDTRVAAPAAPDPASRSFQFMIALKPSA